MNWMLQSKDTKWQTGLKNKSLQYSAYSMRSTLGQRTHIDWKWGDEKNIFHTNRNDKKGVAILISDKIVLKAKVLNKDEEEHYIMIKGSIQGKYFTFIHIYAPNIGALKYIKQTLT